jgi:hypothetical protein
MKMIWSKGILLVGVIGWVAIPQKAIADDAALTTGGLPRMMTSHPSISMTCEVVKLTVHGETIDTDCTFWFTNSGSASTVNMGFPDFGMFAYAQPSDTARTMFKKFQSYVDGKPVPTTLVLGKGPGEQWQTKMISFGKGATRVVHETYTTEVGGVNSDFPVAIAPYVIHTGSSWKGPIGMATVTVNFEPDSEVGKSLDVLYLSVLSKGALKHVLKPGGVVVLGMIRPRAVGPSLIFQRTSWKPSRTDDIMVAYRYPPKVIERLRQKEKALEHHS